MTSFASEYLNIRVGFFFASNRKGVCEVLDFTTGLFIYRAEEASFEHLQRPAAKEAKFGQPAAERIGKRTVKSRGTWSFISFSSITFRPKLEIGNLKAP